MARRDLTTRQVPTATIFILSISLVISQQTVDLVEITFAYTKMSFPMVFLYHVIKNLPLVRKKYTDLIDSSDVNLVLIDDALSPLSIKPPL